jgi:hypothetical protein
VRARDPEREREREREKREREERERRERERELERLDSKGNRHAFPWADNALPTVLRI